MNDNEQIYNSCQERAVPPNGILNRLARGLVLKSLATVTAGHLILIDHAERLEFGDPGSELTSTLRIQHPDFYRRVAFGGTIAAGETYMDGLWSCSDLTTLIRIMVINQEAQQQLEGGLARLTAPLQRLLHRMNDNTRNGSRKNIAAHYDLGNEFYAVFLDPTMAYSCGIFEHPDSSLEEASTAKFDLICRKLGLTPGMQVLEIGTGWGGFALHAAQHYGCHVTTTTISQQQHDLAAQRIAAAGLTERITLLQQDYRDLTGSFDRLVSIEMIEAVGHRHLSTFFRVCAERLKPDGAALIQAITMPDHLYDRYLDAPDFINRYIFPGSCCPSLHAISDAVARSTDLRLNNLEDLSSHYARTLREWRKAFHANLDQVRVMGFDERFIRMWEFYLCYCEGGFAERFTGVVQVLFSKPEYRGEPLLTSVGEESIAMKHTFLTIALLLMTGCGTSLPLLKTVDNVDIKRFMGPWYVIACIPTFIETEAYNGVETYRLDSDGSIDTVFTFNKGGFDGPPKRYNPRGFIVDTVNNSTWGMQFIWPFKSEFLITHLNEDYSRTVIGRNKRDYVWIMARTPQIPEGDYLSLVKELEKQGYDVSRLRKTPQRWPNDGSRP